MLIRKVNIRTKYQFVQFYREQNLTNNWQLTSNVIKSINILLTANLDRKYRLWDLSSLSGHLLLAALGRNKDIHFILKWLYSNSNFNRPLKRTWQRWQYSFVWVPEYSKDICNWSNILIIFPLLYILSLTEILLCQILKAISAEIII